MYSIIMSHLVLNTSQKILIKNLRGRLASFSFINTALSISVPLL